MAEVTLKKRAEEVLKIKIGEDSYSLPLGGSTPYKILKTLNTEEGIFDFLGAHLPEEIMDSLTPQDIRTIFEAWSEATRKQSGLTLGESQASRDS